eukprot:TRINITY_DN55582_c0_g1_i1.p2 TRINITY_DN55582_c0_g1~~TRINITY_DN55582_c0_g1_i1.p2  ORF type:complete len:680 (+),score=176.35 TRINITY_DN55582_c0_g1_i1:103-2142(+)
MMHYATVMSPASSAAEPPLTPGMLCAASAPFRWFRLHGVILDKHEEREGGTVWYRCIVEARDTAPGLLGRSGGVTVTTSWKVWRRFSMFSQLAGRAQALGLDCFGDSCRFPSGSARIGRLSARALEERRNALEAWMNATLSAARLPCATEALRDLLLEFCDAGQHPPRASESDRMQHFRLCALDLIGDDARRNVQRRRFTLWSRWAVRLRRTRAGCRLLRAEAETRLRGAAWRRLGAHSAAAVLRRLRQQLRDCSRAADRALLAPQGRARAAPAPAARALRARGDSVTAADDQAGSFRIAGAIVGGHKVRADGVVVYAIDVEAVDPAPSASGVSIRTKWQVWKRFQAFSDLHNRLGSHQGGTVRFPSQAPQRQSLSERQLADRSRDLEAWLNGMIAAAREPLVQRRAARGLIEAFLESAGHPPRHADAAVLRRFRTRALLRIAADAARRGAFERWRRVAAAACVRRLRISADGSCRVAECRLGAYWEEDAAEASPTSAPSEPEVADPGLSPEAAAGDPPAEADAEAGKRCSLVSALSHEQAHPRHPTPGPEARLTPSMDDASSRDHSRPSDWAPPAVCSPGRSGESCSGASGDSPGGRSRSASSVSQDSQQPGSTTDSCLWTRREDLRFQELSTRAEDEAHGPLSPSSAAELSALQRRYDAFSDHGLAQMMMHSPPSLP